MTSLEESQAQRGLHSHCIQISRTSAELSNTSLKPEIFRAEHFLRNMSRWFQPLKNGASRWDIEEKLWKASKRLPNRDRKWALVLARTPFLHVRLSSVPFCFLHLLPHLNTSMAQVVSFYHFSIDLACPWCQGDSKMAVVCHTFCVFTRSCKRTPQTTVTQFVY